MISGQTSARAQTVERPAFVAARIDSIAYASKGMPAGTSKENNRGVPEVKTLDQRTPVIHRAFAAKEISPGETWKIYLEASAQNGDMTNIFTIIEQGNSFPSITRIHEKNRKHLDGYIFLKTLNIAGPMAKPDLTLKVWIQDAAGHFSEPAVFPLHFENSRRLAQPPPGQFQEENLGPIMVQLVPFGVEGG